MDKIEDETEVAE